MTTLPPYDPNPMLPEGIYAFTVSEEPEIRKTTGGKPYIIMKFLAKGQDGEARKYRDIFVPWEDRYQDLCIALGAVADTQGRVHIKDLQIIGKTFDAEIVHRPDIKDPSKLRDKLTNIGHIAGSLGKEPEGADDLPF